MNNAIFNLELLDSSQKEEIHNTSLSALEETGIQIGSEEVADILDVEGVDIEVGEGKWNKKFWRVKFSRDIIEKALETAPKTVTLFGRVPENDLHLDGRGSPDSIFFGTLGCSPLIRDIETGERRAATRKDLADFARLSDALEHIDYFHISLTPTDVPKQVVNLYRWGISFEHTTKPLMTSPVYDVENRPFLLRMAAAVLGGEEEFQRRPIINCIECPTAPLSFDSRSIENIVAFARLGAPVIVYSEPYAGASGPVTLAGNLVLTNAEGLAGIAVTQIVNPGCPVVKGSVATRMDLRSGNVSFGSPETGILNVATTEMARFYGLPNLTSGGRHDSKRPDCQAGFETQANVLMAALAGGNLNNFAGILESNFSASFSKLVIDDEIIMNTKRILKGMSIENEKLALDVINELGPLGQYMGNAHTLKHMKEELTIPRISSKGMYAEWQRQGSLDLEEVARRNAQEILKVHQPTPVEDKRLEEMYTILEEAKNRKKIRR